MSGDAPSNEPEAAPPSAGDGRVDFDPAQFQLDHAEAIAAIIDLKGYAVEPVRADPDSGVPAYAYSIGVEDLVGQPELCVVGLEPELGSRVIDEFVDHLVGGGDLPIGQPFVGLLGDTATLVDHVDIASVGSLFAGAVDFYSHRPFRMSQIVIADAAGRFPWDDDVDSQLLQAQWLLGR